MLTYKEFINESLELILESDVSFSESFTNILNRINHPLANKILDLHKKDLPVANNFFDLVKDDNSKVSFIQDRKAQQILSGENKYVNFIGGNSGWLRHSVSNSKIFDLLGYKPEGTAFRPNSVQLGEVVSEYKSPRSRKTYQYVKFDNGEGVYNIEKLQKVDPNIIPMYTKGRQDMNVGRAMRALLITAKIDFTNKELEDFVNYFKSTVDLFGGRFSKFYLVSGEKIRYWYHLDNYLELMGSLGSSCMRYDESQEYLDIYVANPEVCNLLILKEGDKIVARALIWTLNDGKKFMDRVYYINESDLNLFREYAKKNGWYAKYINGSSADSSVFDPGGTRTSISYMLVNVKHSEYDYYPYMDTLKYFNPGERTLSINKNSETYELEDTDGSYTYCEYCNGSAKVECRYCDGNGELDCDDCDGSGELDCDTCAGSGEIDCDTCAGDGVIDGEECSDCNGSGMNKCNDCLRGKVECGTCDGSGEEECSNCDGFGEVDCSNC